MSLDAEDEEYFFWEDEKKIFFCQDRLGKLAQVTGGSVFTNQEEETVELRLKCAERPARIMVDYDSGWVRFQVKFANTIGVLTLHYDPQAQQKPVDPDPDWSTSADEVRHFLAPGLYIEEYAQEAQPMLQIANGLPAPLAQRALGIIQTEGVRQLEIDADHIDIRLRRDFHELVQPMQTVSNLFGLMSDLAAYFSSGQQAVAARPRVYVGGQPLQQSQNRISCPYCQAVVDLSEGLFCGHCGAAVKIGES